MQKAPLLYDDIEERKLGRATRIDQEATQQLDDEVSRRENEVAEQELQVADTNKSNLREDALKAIELIQQQEDPMAALAELPPSLQAEVKAILDEQAEAVAGNEQPQGELPPEVGLTGGEEVQQELPNEGGIQPQQQSELPVLSKEAPEQGIEEVPEEQKRKLLPLQ